jgi:hypothetical protein
MQFSDLMLPLAAILIGAVLALAFGRRPRSRVQYPAVPAEAENAPAPDSSPGITSGYAPNGLYYDEHGRIADEPW